MLELWQIRELWIYDDFTKKLELELKSSIYATVETFGNVVCLGEIWDCTEIPS